ncbi:hypothetical protein L2D08_14350 [Domibacillus sp. PGB-M46]|uniref:hypothetical protein n=1 Tax=Domibacillus sp. PGB-M46 TaxID=2910255 RepID=UPI001F590312|nr:hypothetical protein [Domibacillus sp. PGB-M46]MCI2255551.1 hypothetical protein [Domibacillus sp. PGB-M46]
MKKLYNDRGMMNWQGLILAEHTEVTEREKSKPMEADILFDEQRLEESGRMIHSPHLEREVVLKINTFGDHDLL